MVTTHVYQREINPSFASDDSLAVIYAKIEPGSRVLDVGAGSGALGRVLKKNKQCIVHGLTYNPDEALLLQDAYDLAVQVDLEKEALPNNEDMVDYDVVVCADVLEHLRNAHEVLVQLVQRLRPGGRLIFSVPNVSHVAITVGLLNGRFQRTHEGLLDATHVNFFERTSLDKFCADAGVLVVDRDAVYRDLAKTEYAGIDSTALPDSVRHYVERLPDAGVYQFIWTVVPANENKSSALPTIVYPSRPDFDVVARFEMRVYFDFGAGFSEVDSVSVFGVYGDAMQDIGIPVPQNKGSLRAFRLDWPQWPCAIEFAQLVCSNAEGHCILHWNGAWSEQIIFDQCVMLTARGESGFPLLMINSKKSATQITLTKPEDVAAMQLRVGSPYRLLAGFASANQSSGGVQHKLDDLKAIAEQQAELLRYISAQVVTVQDQQYYWQALNQRLDVQERKLIELQQNFWVIPVFLKQAFNKIKLWKRNSDRQDGAR